MPESLVAANEELALTQFGDSVRIGQWLAWEWRCSRGWVSLDMAAVLYTLGSHVVEIAVLVFCFFLLPAMPKPRADQGVLR